MGTVAIGTDLPNWAYRWKVDNCHWVGKGNCAQNLCGSKDIQLRRDLNGEAQHTCYWGIKKLYAVMSPLSSRVWRSKSATSKHRLTVSVGRPGALTSTPEWKSAGPTASLGST